jgi:PAS domain S-box-containing protein
MGNRAQIERLAVIAAAAVIPVGLATAIGLAASLENKGGMTALYILAVGVATWIGGLYAGLLATALAYIPFDYYFVAPLHSFEFASAARPTVIPVFIVTALAVSYMLVHVRRARQQAEEALDEQRRLTAALADSQNRLVSILEETRTGSWEWDLGANELRWSANLAGLHGLEGAGAPTSYESWLELVDPEDRPWIDRTVKEALAGGKGYEFEFRVVGSGVEPRWLWTQASVVRDDQGRAARVVGLVRDVSERRRFEERQQFLVHATETVSAALDYESALGDLARLAVPRLADCCSIDLREEDGGIQTVALAHIDPAKVSQMRALLERRPSEANAPAGVASAVETGRPALQDPVGEELRRLGLRGSLVVPLAVRGEVFGAITLMAFEGRRPYDENDLAFADELARRVSLAIDNARLHRAEQRARERAEDAVSQTERLQRLVAHLSAAATAREAAEVLVGGGSETLGAVAGWVSLLSDDESELVHLASFGYREDFVELHRTIPADSPFAVAEVVRTGEPRWLETTVDDPHLELGEAQQATGAEALVVAPLETVDRRLGFFALRFEGPRSFTEDERLRLLAVTSQCAQALDRALLYERERAARLRAQRASERLVRVQAMTAALAKAMTVGEVARIIAEQGSAAFDADGAAVHLLAEDGARLDLAAQFGEAADVVARLRHLSLEDRHAGVDAVTRKKIVWFESNRDLARRFPEHAELRTGSEAIGLIPLVGVSDALGLLTLDFAQRRGQSLEDRSLLATLVRQCGQALERAQLYEQERSVRAWIRRLQTITEALSAATDVEEVGGVVIDQALGALRTRTGLVALLSGNQLVVTRSRGHEESQDVPSRIELDSPIPIAEAALLGRIVVSGSTADGLRIGVPMLVGRRAVGAFGFSLDATRDFGDDEREFVSALGRQAAQAFERARLYQQEQRARLAAERANDRLRKLEAVAQVGLASQTLDQLLEDLLPLACDLFGADRSTLFLVEEEEPELELRAAVGIDLDLVGRLKIPIGAGIAGRIAGTGQPLLVDDVSKEHPMSPYLREHGGSLLGVPLRVEGRVLGVLTVSSDRLSAFEERDLRILTLAAERVALALERISLYEREHETAVTLQRSVLPEAMPDLEGLQLAARYVPGSTGVEVGGDWYDAVDLGGSNVGFVVGDVVGKGVLAAATMTQLRNALRVYAFEGLKPASVLSRLNRLVESTGPSFATVLYGVVDTRTMSCRFASAGHLPPLLVRGDGSATFLEGGRSVPLGVRSDADYRQETVQLAPGDTLVLYTDGLVERRGRALDEGLAQLRSCAAEAGQASVDALVQCLVGELTEDELSNDDVAVLALRAAAERRPPLRLTLPSEPAVLAALREQLRDWLAGCNVTGNVCDEIVLACSEACANSIEHAQEPTRPEFEVVAETAGSSIVISVRDFGRWREAQNTPDRGLGLRLIEELMDGVEITRTESGTEVRMRRRLEAALTVPV